MNRTLSEYNRNRLPLRGDNERLPPWGNRERMPPRDDGHRECIVEIQTIVEGFFGGGVSAFSRKAYARKVRYKEVFMVDRAPNR